MWAPLREVLNTQEPDYSIIQAAYNVKLKKPFA
jgi:hypothetical protein